MELFKIHEESAVNDNLKQIICNTAKEWFEKSNGAINLFGLIFTADEQIAGWVNRSVETIQNKALTS